MGRPYPVGGAPWAGPACPPGLGWLLLTAGTAGGVLFTGVYLAEGAARAGYNALAQPISALSLGPGGWVQQALLFDSGWVSHLRGQQKSCRRPRRWRWPTRSAPAVS